MKIIVFTLCIAVLLCGFTGCNTEHRSESGTKLQEFSEATTSLEQNVSSIVEVENTSAEIDTDEFPNPTIAPFSVLIGSGYDTFSKYSLASKIEMHDKATTWRDEARAGDTLELSLSGVEAPLKFKYYSTAQNLRFPNEEITYIASGFGQMLIINAQTSELICITFLEHPQGLTLKDKKITLGQARNECSVFVGEYFPDIDMSEWVLQVELDHSDEAMAEFIFMYYRYLNGIEVGQLIFKFDACGNLKMFSQDHYQSEVLPQYTDKEYLASAQARIFEHYYAFDDVAEVKDLRLSKKENAYIPSAECNAIKYTVSYTVVLQDGTELNTANEFFLPYDETGKAITVELNETVDK